MRPRNKEQHFATDMLMNDAIKLVTMVGKAGTGKTLLAIAAYNHQALPPKCVTPHVVLTSKTLPDYYTRTANGWELNWSFAQEHLDIPCKSGQEKAGPKGNLPQQIGFLVPFTEHEWYKNLTSQVIASAAEYKIDVQVIDADQNVRDEVEIRRRQIASPVLRRELDELPEGIDLAVFTLGGFVPKTEPDDLGDAPVCLTCDVCPFVSVAILWAMLVHLS